jgi:carbon monoxide dehydrogenase subunit G
MIIKTRPADGPARGVFRSEEETAMASINVTRRIEAPPQQVFEALSDLRNAADRVSGITRIEMLTDGEIGVGTRFRETRVMFKREATEEMEVTAFEPGRGYTLECNSCGCHYLSRISVAPDGSGTMVEMDTVARPVSVMARLMAPVSKLMMGPMRKCLEKDLDDIKTALEASAGEAAPA